MRRSSKVFLGIGLVLLALSYTHLETVTHGVFKPLGAVFLILAFIANFLPDREYEVFDEDHRVRDQLLEGHSVEDATDPNVPSGTRFEHAR